MAGTVWALGAIGSVPSETLLPLLIRRSAERLDAASGMDLANLLWGFARLDCPISQGTTDRFAVRCFLLRDTLFRCRYWRYCSPFGLCCAINMGAGARSLDQNNRCTVPAFWPSAVYRILPAPSVSIQLC